MTLRSLIVPAAILAFAAQALAQDNKPTVPDDAQQTPPIQARPGTPEGTPRTDQTIDVTKGTRLVLANNAGEVVVTAWDRSAVRVQANHSTREKIDVQTADSVLRIRSQAERGRSGLVDYRVTVPSWMPINLSGTYLDADVSGTAAEVTVETVGGSIRVSGGTGAVSLRSVEGRIVVEKTTGRVQATGVNEGIRLSNTQGEVIVDTTNGDIVVDNAQTSNLEVSTVNGDVTFNGTIRQSGVYKLSTHGGDIRVGLGGVTNAIVFVRTFQGDFSADFPIQLPEGQSADRGSKRFNFTLGAGSARIELQSFNGDIHLARTTVVSVEEERRQRRLVRPPKPPNPPNPPNPPKPPKPPGVDVDVHHDHDFDVDVDVDVDVLRDMAKLKVDEWQMKIDVEEMNRAIEESLRDMNHDVLDALDEALREVPVPPVPPVPPVLEVPPAPPVPLVPPLPPTLHRRP
jgi:hypothetical protein